MGMVKKPVKDKEPIIWGYLDWSCWETGMEDFGPRPCGGLFVFIFLTKLYEKVLNIY